MRNSDKVNFVGFSTGGKGCNGTKVRFAVEKVRRSKVLQKIGATNIIWHALPEAMTKADAVNYLQNQTTSLSLDQVQQEAVARATNRLIPKTKTAPAPKAASKAKRSK
jgi:hypothetical protein